MKFEEIFNEDGLYIADGFIKGVAFKIAEPEYTLRLVTFKSENDLMPQENIFPIYKGLFNKEYKKVYTRKELFK